MVSEENLVVKQNDRSDYYRMRVDDTSNESDRIVDVHVAKRMRGETKT